MATESDGLVISKPEVVDKRIKELETQLKQLRRQKRVSLDHYGAPAKAEMPGKDAKK